MKFFQIKFFHIVFFSSIFLEPVGKIPLEMLHNFLKTFQTQYFRSKHMVSSSALDTAHPVCLSVVCTNLAPKGNAQPQQ